jgi:hypothetical protein
LGGPIGGAFGGAVGGLASTGTPQGMIGGGIGGYFGGATWQDVLANAATSAAKKYALNAILSAVFGSGGGSGSVDFAGMNDGGLMASLSGLMGSIAPKSDTFAFSARDGLDYVPRDNFRINAHEGEAVLKRDEAEAWRSGKAAGGSGSRTLQPIILQIDRQTLAEVLLDMSNDNVKVIHQRGIVYQ